MKKIDENLVTYILQQYGRSIRHYGVANEDTGLFLILLCAHKDDVFTDFDIESSNENLNNIIRAALLQSPVYSKLVKPYLASLSNLPPAFLFDILIGFRHVDQFDLRANFQSIFDSLLYSLADLRGKHSGEFIQPIEVTRFIMQFVKLPDNAYVYNPFAGVASFATFLRPHQRYYGQEINLQTWTIGTLRLMAYGHPFENYKLEDSISNWNNFGEFDLIVSNPPFGLRLNNKSSLYGGEDVDKFLIERSLEQLPKSGQLICILPLSFLYRGGRERGFRQYLVDNNYIDTIISLPQGIFKHTGIPSCIILFNRHYEARNIKMVDASHFVIDSIHREKRLDDKRLNSVLSQNDENEFVRNISPDILHDSDLNMLVQRYFAGKYEGTPLRDLTAFMPGTRTERGKYGKLVRIRDLKDSIIDNELDLLKIEPTLLPLGNIRKIEQSCLLLATRWKTLKPTIFNFENEAIYVSADIIALTINQKLIDPKYLVSALHSENVKNQLEHYRIPGIIPTIFRNDLFRIKVELPPVTEQVRIYNKNVDQYISSKVEEIAALNYGRTVDVNDENSFLRHQIAGSLKNVRGAFKLLKRVLVEQVKPIVPGLDDLKADPESEFTLKRYLEIIERDLNSINKSVNKVGETIELMDLNKENFDLLLFIKDYVDGLRIRANNFYEVYLDLDEDAIKEFGITAIHIEGDKDLIRKMFDNIIENAEKHAFQYGISNNNKIAIQLLYDFEQFEVQIDIGNTGSSLPASMTHDAMIRRGSSSGPHSGNGIGIWYVNEVMKIHNGRFGYTDETGPEGIDSEFVTTMELTFPIIPAI
ncbi:MAG: hypothetical protein EOO51_08385 [Flavobacterium sp.]|nr:MAG: hypothetical protein EOO51_08385 [Flavobacterium sp.]